MTRRYLRIALLGSLVSLTACAQQSEVKQMHQSISTLSAEMTQLNKETVKITQQNALNAKSTRGAYLLPGANTPARLNSQVGTLRMSLRNIAANAQGTALTLRIQGVQRSASGLYRHRGVGANPGHYRAVSGSQRKQPAVFRAGKRAGAERCRHSAAA